MQDDVVHDELDHWESESSSLLPIILSYAGTSLPYNVLLDIRRHYIHRLIKQRIHSNFLYYNLVDNQLVAISLHRICRCPYVMCCMSPTCYSGRTIVSFVNVYYGNRAQLRIEVRDM